MCKNHKNYVFSIIILLFTFNICNANNNDFISKFPDNIKIIGCYNTKSGEISKTNEKGNCYKGKNYQNIMIPPKSHVEKYFNVYYNTGDIVRILPTINFESGFNVNNENNHAKGYIQTLKKYNIKQDIESQLKWLKNRQDSQINNKNQCGFYDNGSIERIKCLYRYHYHSKKGYSYAEKHYKVYKFYKDYFNN